MRARTEQEWIRLLKESEELKPDQEYIHQTRKKLLYEARKLRSKREKKKVWRMIWPSMMAVTIAAFLILTTLHQVNLPVQHSASHNSVGTENKTAATNKETKVFIYHTHSQESFETKEVAGYNPKKNVRTVGKKLGTYLNKESVPTAVNTTDYVKQLLKEKMEYKEIYELSRHSVKDAVKTYPNVQLLLDIHRDGEIKNRQSTTTKINGKNVATVLFIIYKNQPYTSENTKLAIELDKALNELYPGVSRGVVQKDKGIASVPSYNQDLHEGTIMVNIGGVENTLKEETRTAKMLAKAIKVVLKEKAD
ncbi:hypothetical protein COK01_02265 [Priestia megaterium]|uniref:stage II sporulation protein P n=1 Tax=Priestia megaterium TaxID=1404 RepID=UPI000BF5A948|nr:stage II sporulation protein P [Priestia megaterium]PFP52055.1 hypothetical protein COK01_02265 [Priestia megaterium]